jgi:long-chain acyl-CoA synthetase
MAGSTILLDHLEKRCAENPEALCVLDPFRQLTRGQLMGEAKALGTALASATDKPVVAVFLPMTGAFCSAFLGTWYAGKAVLPLNMLLKPEDLGAILADSGADLVVTLPDFKEKLSALPVKVMAITELKPTEASAPRPKPDKLATLLYTSGSTGQPKGVELTHLNLLSNCEGGVQAMGLDESHRVLACLPTFHTYAITGTFLAGAIAGSSIVCIPKFDTDAVLGAISKMKCTVMIGVPSMYRLLIRKQERAKLPHELRVAIAGAEPLPGDVADKFEQTFGIPLFEGYGMTETSPVISVNSALHCKPGTAGLPIAGVKVRIVDPESLKEMPLDQTGEIWVQGTNVMRGYRNRPDETAQVLTKDGWLRTGDMGQLDAEGFLKITGRLKEMIKVGGEMVFPAEVENALSKHSAVGEVGVIGVKDKRRGESVKAFVALAPGQSATADDLLAHCRELLTPYQVPRTIEFRDSLPKAPTGKVLRRLLK